MIDTIVKRLKDQLFVARSYYPSIAKLKGKETLTRELKQNIQEHERVLSESIVDADLPSLWVFSMRDCQFMSLMLVLIDLVICKCYSLRYIDSLTDKISLKILFLSYISVPYFQDVPSMFYDVILNPRP